MNEIIKKALEDRYEKLDNRRMALVAAIKIRYTKRVYNEWLAVTRKMEILGSVINK